MTWTVFSIIIIHATLFFILLTIYTDLVERAELEDSMQLAIHGKIYQKTIFYYNRIATVQFTSPQTGYLLNYDTRGGYADVYKTLDAGKTWNMIDAP